MQSIKVNVEALEPLARLRGMYQVGGRTARTGTGGKAAAADESIQGLRAAGPIAGLREAAGVLAATQLFDRGIEHISESLARLSQMAAAAAAPGFNGDGAAADREYQQVKFGILTQAGLIGLNTEGLGIQDTAISTPGAAASALERIPSAAAQLGEVRKTVAADRKEVVQALTHLQSRLAPGAGRPAGAGQAAVLARGLAYGFNREPGTALLAQANVKPAGVLALLRR